MNSCIGWAKIAGRNAWEWAIDNLQKSNQTKCDNKESNEGVKLYVKFSAVAVCYISFGYELLDHRDYEKQKC